MSKKHEQEHETGQERAVPAPRTLPRWEELPDLELYLDQVIALMERYLGASAASGKPLTSSMVNNYVKTGLLPAPVKKRYARKHLAYLLVICALKPVLPLSAIQKLLSADATDEEIAQLYDRFCTLFAGAEAAAFKDIDGQEAFLRAALTAQAHQAVALALSDSD